MKRKELKFIIDDLNWAIKKGEITEDNSLHILTNDGNFCVLNIDTQKPVKIKITNIESAILYNADKNALYLKNGLSSARKMFKL